jgi:hypothetical protein
MELGKPAVLRLLTTAETASKQSEAFWWFDRSHATVNKRSFRLCSPPMLFEHVGSQRNFAHIFQDIFVNWTRTFAGGAAVRRSMQVLGLGSEGSF